MSSANKYIIVDFDHTIGYFKQIIYILNIIETHYLQGFTKDNIFQILDKYPYIFRPKIYNILEYICSNKSRITFFILYTFNNNKKFVHLIIEYMKQKLKISDDLFDYKIFQGSTKNGKSIEYLESQILPKGLRKNEHVIDIYCYIDDKRYDLMMKKNVQYIHCEKYIFNYSQKDIIKEFPFNIIHIKKSILKKYMKKYDEKLQKNNLPRGSFVLSSLNLLALVDDFIHG
jgi:hypothetical protein